MRDVIALLRKEIILLARKESLKRTAALNASLRDQRRELDASFATLMSLKRALRQNSKASAKSENDKGLNREPAGSAETLRKRAGAIPAASDESLNIKAVRRRLGLSRAGLAALLNVHPAGVSRWEARQAAPVKAIRDRLASLRVANGQPAKSGRTSRKNADVE